jgi:type I restriction enzyme S subunit
MDAATAALFPDSMEDSELGLIPKGWDIKNISSLGKVVTGKTPSTKKAEYWGIDIPFVTIPDMHGNLLITTTSRSLSKAGADSQRNQYVARGSAMVSCIATPGLVSYATTDCQTNQQINSVIPTDGNDGAWLFWHLRAMIPSLIRNSGVGTVFANLNKSDFSNILSIIPPRNLIHSFSKIGETVLEEMKSLSLEAIHLVSIRDSLLPRLISGELQIPEEMLAS